MKSPFTHRTLKSLLAYDPASGNFTWLPRKNLPRWNGRYAGKVAGYMHTDPKSGATYVYLSVLNYPYLAHRLAWFYMTGKWPKQTVDHKDCDGTNNKWANLRAATVAQNAHNSRTPKTNKTGFKGVSVCPATGKFRANIKINNRQTYLGSFLTPQDAHAAYVRAASGLRGEFARAA